MIMLACFPLPRTMLIEQDKRMDKLSPIEGEVAFAETCLADNDPA